MRFCKRCSSNRPDSDFNPTGAYCRDCSRAMTADSRQKNRERHAANPPDPSTLVRCSTCKAQKPGSEFWLDPATKTGFGNRCHACSRANSAGHRAKHAQAHRAQPVDLNGDKECPRCEKVLARTLFGRNASALDGLDAYCRPCRAQVVRMQRDRKQGSA